MKTDLRLRFWKFAHDRYNGRRPSLAIESVAFGWGLLHALLYGGGLLTGGRPSSPPELIVAILFVCLPLTFGFLHRRIRIERLKGPSALYLKYHQHWLRLNG